MADHAGLDPEVYLYTGRGGIPRNAVRVEVHRSVKFIPDRLFQGCDRLESVLLHDGLLGIGHWSFDGCSSLRIFRCPSTVTEIGMGAFQRCSNLTSVELPGGLEGIQDSTFYRCTSLGGLQIPASVARIGVGAFEGCTNLRSVGLREGLRWIGYGAFEGCRSLGGLRVPSSVVQIGERAFMNCRSLVSVRLREDLPTVKWGAFGGCPPESFRFARLSERTEAAGMDARTTSMFESRLNQITNAITEVRHYANPKEAEDLWEKCKKSLGRAHEVLTYLELKGAAPVLELALWKARIEDKGEGSRRDLVDDDGGRLSREDCRVRCGAGIVFGEALKFFACSVSWPGLDDFA